MGFINDPASPSRQIARHNAAAKEGFQFKLISLRAQTLDDTTMAERLGISVEALHLQEVYWHEWSLHEVTLYALAMGARVTFDVEIA